MIKILLITVVAFLLSIGSAAAQTSTMLYKDANGNIGVGTTRPQGAFIVTNGNVGIGTWTSSALLHVVQPGVGDAFRVDDAAGGDTTPFVIDSTGNVGFGTTLLGAKLNIAGASNMFEALRLENDFNWAEDRGTKITFYTPYSTGQTKLGGEIVVANNAFVNSNDMYFTTDTNGVVTEKMRITNFGNVGIGTKTPQGSLIVTNGNVGIGTWTAAGGNLIVNGGGNVGINTIWPGQALDVNGTVRATAFVGDGSGLTGVSAAGWSQSGTNVSMSGANNVGIGTTTPQADLVVTAGNVGIGTWTSSALLHVVQPGVGDAFRVDDVAGGDANPFIISSTGNVGIATTNPRARLDIFQNNSTGAIDSLSEYQILLYTAGASNSYGFGTETFHMWFNSDGGYKFYNDGAAVFFMIDQSGNVGISTYQPTSRLEISTTDAQNLFRVNDNGFGDSTPFIIASDGNVGIGTFNPFGGQLIIPTTNGNVGIGSLAPGKALDVTGTVRATAFVGDGSGLTGVAGGGFIDGGTNVYLSTATDNVGIGTTSPAANLQISGSANTVHLIVKSSASQSDPFNDVEFQSSSGVARVKFYDLNNSPRIIYNYSGSNGGDFTGQLNGVDQMSFGFNNAGSFGGSAGAASGRSIYFYDRVSAAFRGAINASGDFYWGTTTSAFSVKLTAPASGSIPIAVRGSAGQTANLQEWQNSSGTVLSAFNPKGNLGIGTATPQASLVVTNGNVGIGTWTAGALLDLRVADNGTGQRITIGAAQASVTAADTFISFNSTTGQEGSIAGTGSAGVIAYNTFTGSHWSKIDNKEGLEVNMVLEATGEKFLDSKQQLVKSRICETRKSQAVWGVYGGTNEQGYDFVLALGTGFIWVANTNGDINIGDYLQSSSVRGHAEKQDDNVLRNYSIAKALEQVKWKKGEKRRLIACTYHAG